MPIIPAPKLRDILRVLYRDCTGMLECRALPSTERVFVSLDNLRPLGVFLDAHRYENVYWGVSTRRDASSGKLENCQHLPALFLDADFKTTPETEVRQRLAAFPLQPSIVIHSGGGLHLYFLLEEPLDLQVPAECDQARSLLRRLALHFECDLASAEPARVLRIPGTKNFKPDYPAPQPVVVEAFVS
jgi:hypothetical protein